MGLDYNDMSGLVQHDPPQPFNPVELQRTLQVALTGEPCEPAETWGELLERSQFNITAIQMELAELLEQLPWKDWRTGHVQERTVEIDPEDRGDSDRLLNLKFEVIDIFHFILNLAIAMDMTWEEMMRIFYTKHRENLDRKNRGY